MKRCAIFRGISSASCKRAVDWPRDLHLFWLCLQCPSQYLPFQACSLALCTGPACDACQQLFVVERSLFSALVFINYPVALWLYLPSCRQRLPSPSHRGGGRRCQRRDQHPCEGSGPDGARRTTGASVARRNSQQEPPAAAAKCRDRSRTSGRCRRSRRGCICKRDVQRCCSGGSAQPGSRRSTRVDQQRYDKTSAT